MTGYTLITRKEFYAQRGFANPKLVRVTRSGHYAYFSRN